MEAWCVVEHEKPLQKLHLDTIPTPTGTQVLIKVTHCGVCHSDLHFVDGFYDLGGGKTFRIADRGATLPRAIGHEILGEVVSVGDAVSDSDKSKDAKVGVSRAVYPWVGCGKCRRCEEGDDQMCASQKSLGVYENGGFAEYVIVPHAKYLVDYGDVRPEVACTFGCSGLTCLGAVKKILPMPSREDAVVLLGAGGLGLQAIAMLKALGHEHVVSVDVSEGKREAALKVGARSFVVNEGEDTAKRIMEAAGGPVYATIDFVNNSQTAAMAFAMLTKGGKMVQVGVMGGQLDLSLVTLIFKGVTIMSNLTGNLATMKEVCEMAKAGKLVPTPTSTRPWDDADAALTALREGKVSGRLILVK